jgi:hypothetical protein
MGDQSVARPIQTHRIKAHNTNNRALNGIRILAFERAKTVHAFDRAATVTG